MVLGRRQTESVRAERIVEPVRRMKVLSRTLGSNLDFNLGTANVSRTGLLLTQGNYKRVPFALNTLLELTIDPDASVFQEPVRCLGKIVRTTDTVPKSFGIHIVQIEGRDQKTWEATLAKFEPQKALELPVA